MLSYDKEARDIRAAINSGIPPTPTEPADIASMSQDESIYLLNKIRPRLYAISAVFGDMVLNHFDTWSQQFAPYGLVDYRQHDEDTKPATEVKTFKDLGLCMERTIRDAQDDLFHSKRRLQHFETWYSEADLLLGFFRNSNVKFFNNSRSPEQLLNGGFGTGVNVTVRTLDLVDAAHQEFAPDATDDEIEQTAQLAEKIPRRLAATVAFERIMQGLNALGGIEWDNRFTPAGAFSLGRFAVIPRSDKPNVLSISYNDTSLASPRDPRSKLTNKDTKLELLRCPGLVNFSQTEDPFGDSIDRVYKKLVRLSGSLSLWRNDTRMPEQNYLYC